MEIAHNRLPRTKQELSLISIRVMIVSAVLFFNSVSTTYLYPFLPQMMIKFNLTSANAATIATAFFVGKLVSSYFWGFVIDRYGRKLGLLISLGSTSLLTLLFGYSNTYHGVLALRALLGFSNGLTTIGKVLATEIVPDDLKPWSISITTSVWALGMTAGAAMGDYLYNGDLDEPHLAPSFVVALIGGLLIPLFYIFFQETLINESTYQTLPDNETQQIRVLSNETVSLCSCRQFCMILYSPNTFKLALIFAINTLFASAIGEILPYWLATDYKKGGLNLNPEDISRIYTALTSFQIILQIYLYPTMQKRVGDFWILNATHWIFILTFFFIPYAHEFDKDNVFAQKNWVIFWMFAKNLSSFMAFCALLMFMNDSVSSHKRGRLNGLSVTLASLLQIVGPMCFGPMLVLSIEIGIPFPFDYHFAFLALCLITAGVLVIILRLQFMDSQRRKLRSDTDS